MTESVETPPLDAALPAASPEPPPLGKLLPERQMEPPLDASPPLAPAEPLSSDRRSPGRPTGPASRLRPHLLAWLTALALLVLAGSQAALWVHVLVSPSGTKAFEQRLQGIDARVTQLEQHPVSPELAPLQARLVALERRLATSGGRSAPIAEALDLAPLQARIAALEQRAPPPTAPNSNDSLTQRLGDDEERLARLEKATRDQVPFADRISRIARVAAAFVALSVGQPLGDLPDAPPALARYAVTAPPTEAALRLAFPTLAQAALVADHPTAGKPFLTRILVAARDLVTIRQGEHVLIGDPAAGVLAHVQTALDAGDLAGAAAAAATLKGPAAQALAPWLDQVTGLLAARAALSRLAAQT